MAIASPFAEKLAEDFFSMALAFLPAFRPFIDEGKKQPLKSRLMQRRRDYKTAGDIRKGLFDGAKAVIAIARAYLTARAHSLAKR